MVLKGIRLTVSRLTPSKLEVSGEIAFKVKDLKVSIVKGHDLTKFKQET